MFISIVAGLFLGPFMPMDTDIPLPQSPINWIIRLVVYILIAYAIGAFSELLREEHVLRKSHYQSMLESRYATIFSLVKLSESRDDYTGTHIERIAEMTRLIATELKKTEKYKDFIDDEYIDTIFRTSPLHDVGKVGIPDNILLKKGKLDEEEFEIMKKHTVIGWETLHQIKRKHPESDFIEHGMAIARYHHEKWDGSGYPDGLAGEEIPLKARITAIVDVYDALRSARPYKDGYSHRKAISIIKDGRGTHFDPFVLEVFLRNAQGIKKIYTNYVGENIEETWAME